MTRPHPPHGLLRDLDHLAFQARRRGALRMLGGLAAGALPLVGCGGGEATTTESASETVVTPVTTPTPGSSCTAIPEETAGPYPGDGTNTYAGSVVNVLTQSGVVRRDIRPSFGTLAGTAAGVPLTVTLRLVGTASSCASLEGHAIYLWHCTREGGYSLYSSGVTDQNFLRGVQVTDAAGEVTFTTIFPGCYSGRWPHIHFEVFSSLATATRGTQDVRTSQLALPAPVCQAVYAGATGYASSAANLGAISLASDNIFGDDGAALQMATVTGDLANGYVATLTIAV